MKNRIDTKGLLMHYLLRRDGEASEEIVSYCLNEVENGRGKQAFKGRLQIQLNYINFKNWEDFYFKLNKVLYND